MKRSYERPVYLIEDLAVNQVVAATCSGSQMSTQCLQGGQVDSYNVVSSYIGVTCSIDAGIAENVIGAVKVGSNNGTSGTYNGTLGGYSGRCYDTPNGADALLYFCKSFGGEVTKAPWKVDGNVLVHLSGQHGGSGAGTYKGGQGQGGDNNWHCEVIGVSTSTVSSV